MQGFILAAFSIIPAAEKLTLILDLTYDTAEKHVT